MQMVFYTKPPTRVKCLAWCCRAFTIWYGWWKKWTRNPPTYMEKMHVNGGKGWFLVERNTKGGWKAMEKLQIQFLFNILAKLFSTTYINWNGWVPVPNANDFSWQIYELKTMKILGIWVGSFGLPIQKNGNFSGLPSLSTMVFFWFTWPGQVEYLTIVNHISKLDQQV